MNFVILNGEVTNRNLAKVDIEDRGYQFGDGIYEVIRVYNGKMFAAEGHMKRLFECAKKINLVLPFSNTEIELKLNNLIKINQLDKWNCLPAIYKGGCAAKLMHFRHKTQKLPLSPIQKKWNVLLRQYIPELRLL